MLRDFSKSLPRGCIGWQARAIILSMPKFRHEVAFANRLGVSPKEPMGRMPVLQWLGRLAYPPLPPLVRGESKGG